MDLAERIDGRRFVAGNGPDDPNIEIAVRDLRERNRLIQPQPECPFSRLFGRLRVEPLVALGQRDPGLFAPGPEMDDRVQPRRIIQRTASHAVQTIIRARRAANPTTTLRANQTGLYPAAVGGALNDSRLDPHEAESRVAYEDCHREGAAR